MSSEQIDDVFKCSDFDYQMVLYERNLLLPLAPPVFWEEPVETYIDYIVFTLIETFEARDRNLKVNGIIRRIY
jgi:hypothetical protein